MCFISFQLRPVPHSSLRALRKPKVSTSKFVLYLTAGGPISIRMQMLLWMRRRRSIFLGQRNTFRREPCTQSVSSKLGRSMTLSTNMRTLSKTWRLWSFTKTLSSTFMSAISSAIAPTRLVTLIGPWIIFSLVCFLFIRSEGYLPKIVTNLLWLIIWSQQKSAAILPWSQRLRAIRTTVSRWMSNA